MSKGDTQMPNAKRENKTKPKQPVDVK